MMSSLLDWLRPRRSTIVNQGSRRMKTTSKLWVESLEDRIGPATGFIYGTIPAVYSLPPPTFPPTPPTLIQQSSIVRIDATTGDQQTILSPSPYLNPIAVQPDGTLLLIQLGGITQFNPAANPPVPPTK